MKAITILAFLALGACTAQGTFHNPSNPSSQLSVGNTALAAVGALVFLDAIDNDNRRSVPNYNGADDWHFAWDYVEGYGWYCRGVSTERIVSPTYCSSYKSDRRWPNY